MPDNPLSKEDLAKLKTAREVHNKARDEALAKLEKLQLELDSVKDAVLSIPPHEPYGIGCGIG